MEEVGFLCLKVEFRNANQENDHKPQIRCLTERGSEGWVGQKQKKKRVETRYISILMYAATPVLISLDSRKTDILSRISVGL